MTPSGDQTKIPESSLASRPLRTALPALSPQLLLAAGFVLGTGAGIASNLFLFDDPWLTWLLRCFVRPVEQLFLGILYILIVPLLFSAIVSGISRLRSNTEMTGLVMVGLSYMLAVSASGALIGLAMANLFRPGDGIPPDVGRELLAMHVPRIPRGVQDFVASVDSSNSMVMLLVVVSLTIGILAPIQRRKGGRWLLHGSEKLFALGMRVLALVTRFAPLAVACFMFDMTIRFGWHLLLHLGAYAFVVVTALELQVMITFFIVVWMRGGLAPTRFLRGVQEAMLIAFCTSSSNATLPAALKAAEGELRLPGRIVRPLLGIGTVANQSGTTIYIAVTVLFIGQFFGTDLSLGSQALLFAIATLAGMGTIGVPGGALPTLAIVLVAVGLPPEGIALAVGIDRLLDMFRTLVNVVGDLAIAVALSREKIAASDTPPPAANSQGAHLSR